MHKYIKLKLHCTERQLPLKQQVTFKYPLGGLLKHIMGKLEMSQHSAAAQCYSLRNAQYILTINVTNSKLFPHMLK